MVKLFIILCFASLGCTHVEKGILPTPVTNEASLSEIGTPNYDPIVIGSYIMPREVEGEKNKPCVNVYLLETEPKDTIAILSTHIGDVGFDIKTINPWIKLAEAKRFEGCIINASRRDVEKIKRFKYKYCTVEFAIDD